jgi:hypothetical protein
MEPVPDSLDKKGGTRFHHLSGKKWNLDGIFLLLFVQRTRHWTLRKKRGVVPRNWLHWSVDYTAVDLCDSSEMTQSFYDLSYLVWHCHNSTI